jgi:hypothetical protein
MLCASLFLALFSLFVLQPFISWRALGVTQAVAQDAKPSEKEAFEVAKDLGTKEAWNAFLTSYPSGFYADMARAYLKKADGQPDTAAPAPATAAPAAQPQPPALVPSSARAGQRECSERNTLRSVKSVESTKITFVNKSGMYRGIMWVDHQGKLQDFGGVNSGDQVTFDTYRAHPWMIVTGPGDCLQIFTAAAEPAIVELVRLKADGPPAPKTTSGPPPKAVQPLVCAKNYTLQNGNCVLVQNCGSNAYRSPEGDCYCNKGYRMQGGKCVWPQDKQGFEIAPWKKDGCKTWQNECRRGNARSCTRFEETCQVN